MTDDTRSGGRRGTYVVAAATVVFLVIGVMLIFLGVRSTAGPPQPDSDAVPIAPATSAPDPPRDTQQHQKRQHTQPDAPDVDVVDFGPILPASPPVALDIASIDVHSTHLVNLGLAADNTIEVPEDASMPGWFEPGPSPGQFGPAVIAGHVDSDAGPAVFYRLGELTGGDLIRVTRADGTIATFFVDRVEAFDKSTFPTHEVYGNTTNRAELRLVTCGGTYDDDEGYLGNVVAFAHLIRPAG